MLVSTGGKNDKALYASSGMVIPNSLKFSTPKYGPVGKRKEIRLPSASALYSSSTEKIVRFYFNNDGLIDCRKGYIAFDLNLTVTGGTYQRLSQGVWSIFDRVRLTVGEELEDILEYNLLSSLLFESLRDEDIGDVIGPSCYGFATQAERNTFGQQPTTSYAMPLFVGFFGTGVLPVGLLKQRLQLELYLADPTKCVETDGSNPIITLTNLYFHYDDLALGEAMQAELFSVAQGGIQYPFRKFTHYTQPIISARNNLVIPHAGAGIETLLHVIRRSDNQSVMTTNDKFLTYLALTVTDHQLRINSDLYPPERTDCTGPQAYVQYLKYIDKWLLNGVFRNPPAISISEYQTTRFIIVNQIETYPDEGLINPMTTQTAGSNMFLMLNMSLAPSIPVSLDTFVQSYGVTELRNGKLSH
jgi:hypothetical protein